MDQINIGKFIAACRKEKELTQEQLAEKLNITDRAVSKWETGKSMPDSSIMLALCEILEISVNELLSGEKITPENYTVKADENLITLKKKNENHTRKGTIIAAIYTAAMLIGIMVCCICDIAVSGTLTWSLITLTSISFAWIISFPVIWMGKKGLLCGMAAITILLIPFLYTLSVIIKAAAVFHIGTKMAILTLIFMWLVYAAYFRLRNRKMLAAGISFLIAVPFTLLVNITLSKMIGEPVIDMWDILSVFILLITAFACITFDYARKSS